MTGQDRKILHDFVLIYSIPTDFVVVERINGLRFVIHPNENCGHNEAHIHIEDGSCDFEISLKDFSILNCSGKPNPRKVKLAQKLVQEHQKLFVDNWNEFTNGVKIAV